eukprot:1190554-Prorocentrum_minimum.AAC.2
MLSNVIKCILSGAAGGLSGHQSPPQDPLRRQFGGVRGASTCQTGACRFGARNWGTGRGTSCGRKSVQKYRVSHPRPTPFLRNVRPECP